MVKTKLSPIKASLIKPALVERVQQRLKSLLASAVLTIFIFLAPILPVSAKDNFVATWSLCTNPIPQPEHIITKPISGDIYITADGADVVIDKLSTLSGNIEIIHDDKYIRADSIQFDHAERTALIKDNIQYWDKFFYINADEAHIQFDSDTKQLKNIEYKIAGGPGHGKSASLNTRFGTETYMIDATYSGCHPNSKFWEISASEIKLDHLAGWGNAKNVIFKLVNIPLFYSPYLSFPINNKRKTGFLIPAWGNSNRNGAEIQIPFYWNIAPHMDATFTSKLMSSVGTTLAGRLRHLSQNSHSNFGIEYLNSDKKFNDKHRYLVDFKHQYQFADSGHIMLNYNKVSDRSYFEDFSTTLGSASTRFLKQHAEASYGGSWWHSNIKLENYQSIDQTSTTYNNYRYLPQISFNAYSPYKNNMPHYILNSEFSYFDNNNDNRATNLITGSRLILLPAISYPYRTHSTFLIPKLTAHYTYYHFDKNTASRSNQSTRFLPITSIDSGISLERKVSLFNKSFLQTLEPRLFYLYIPEKNQQGLPLFDTGWYDFSTDSLFRENRFNGHDRIGDANQLTMALTSRFIDQHDGKEKALLNIGQIYYLHDRKVSIQNNDSTLTNNRSPLIITFNATSLDHWQFKSNFQWQPDDNTIKKIFTRLQYKLSANKIINLGYYKRDDILSSANITDVEQSKLSFNWILRQDLKIVGKWNYAIPDSRSLEILGGIEYDSCCWGINIFARHFLTDSHGNFDTGIFLQLELKNLSDALF